MKSYTIYFFRHGTTKGNLNAQYIGHTDYPLTTDSIAELKNIKAREHYPKVSAVFSSPLKRCKDSAAIMFPENKIIILDDFIEYNFGEFDGHSAEELKDDDNFKSWLGGSMEARPPFGESNAEFIHRICRVFEKMVDGCVKTGTDTIAVVGHSGVLTTLLACYGLPEAPMAHWQMDAGYGYKLRLTPSLWMRANKIEVVDTAPTSMKTSEES